MTNLTPPDEESKRKPPAPSIFGEPALKKKPDPHVRRLPGILGRDLALCCEQQRYRDLARGFVAGCAYLGLDPLFEARVITAAVEAFDGRAER